MGDDTSFVDKIKGASKTKKVVAGGGGLSVAALIYLHSTFALRLDLDKTRQSQVTQWQQISQLRDEIHEIKGRNDAYEMLLRYLTTGVIDLRTNPVLTNGSSAITGR